MGTPFVLTQTGRNGQGRGATSSLGTAGGARLCGRCLPRPPQVVSSEAQRSRDTSLNRPDTTGTASPAPPLVVSSGAERSRDTSLNLPDTTGDATSVGVSPLCPDGGRDDVFSGGSASPAHPRVVSSGAERSRDISLNQAETIRGASPAHPPSGRVERSAAQSRHLHGSGGYERDRYLRGGLSTSPRRGRVSGRDDVDSQEGCLPRPVPEHDLTNGASAPVPDLSRTEALRSGVSSLDAPPPLLHDRPSCP